MDLQNQKRHLGLLHSTVDPLLGLSPSWTGRVAGAMEGLLKKVIMIPKILQIIS